MQLPPELLNIGEGLDAPKKRGDIHIVNECDQMYETINVSRPWSSARLLTRV